MLVIRCGDISTHPITHTQVWQIRKIRAGGCGDSQVGEHLSPLSLISLMSLISLLFLSLSFALSQLWHKWPKGNCITLPCLRWQPWQGMTHKYTTPERNTYTQYTFTRRDKLPVTTLTIFPSIFRCNALTFSNNCTSVSAWLWESTILRTRSWPYSILPRCGTLSDDDDYDRDWSEEVKWSEVEINFLLGCVWTFSVAIFFSCCNCVLTLQFQSSFVCCTDLSVEMCACERVQRYGLREMQSIELCFALIWVEMCVWTCARVWMCEQKRNLYIVRLLQFSAVGSTMFDICYWKNTS